MKTAKIAPNLPNLIFIKARAQLTLSESFMNIDRYRSGWQQQRVHQRLIETASSRLDQLTSSVIDVHQAMNMHVIIDIVNYINYLING